MRSFGHLSFGHGHLVIFDLRTRNNINEHEEDFNEHGIILTNTNLTNLTNFFLCAAIRVIRAIRVQKTKMMNVENNQECFVQLWLRLERTRRLLGGQYKRFCIRNVLKAWFGYEATDDFIWEICHLAAVDDEPQEGWNELPLPSLYPRKHRELLRAIVAVRLGISYWKINLKALDKAYSIAFPNSTPINVNKKKRNG